MKQLLQINLLSSMLLIMLAFANLGSIYADELHLKDGSVLEGVVSRDGEEYVLEAAKGAKMRFSPYEVLKVEKKYTPQQLYKNLLAVTSGDDFEGQMQLGEWCSENGLVQESKMHYMNAVKLRPANPNARRKAGYRLYKKKWLTHEEYMLSLGRVKYKGRWYSAKEAAEKAEKDFAKDVSFKMRQKIKGFYDAVANAEDPSQVIDNAYELHLIGDKARSAVLRAASNNSYKKREASIYYMVYDDAPSTYNMLIKRLRFEDNPRIVKLLVRLIPKRSEKEKLLQEAINMTVHGKNKKSRMRSAVLLRALQDKRAIDALVEVAGFNPVPEEEMEKEKTSNGTVSSTTYVKPRKPYYPATTALKMLTGMNYSADTVIWTDWWKRSREEFEFKPLSKMPEITELEKKFGNAK